MSERSLHIIQAYLQREDVQERIRQNIQRGRSEATVTIGRAARLFDFTENKLRDWETLGLLTPLKPTGQRQYTPEELDKLAIIKELIDEGGYTPGMIPHDIDRIWDSLSREQKDQTLGDGGSEVDHRHIDQRVDAAYAELFWRYYVSQVLRLSISLICEDIPDTIAGLILPLQESPSSVFVHFPEELSKVGESLVGWLGHRSFSAFLTAVPSFEYPSDYRVLLLQEMKEDMPQRDTPKICSWIVVERKARPLTLSEPTVETLCRLLVSLYEEIPTWRSSFGLGMRDWFYPTTDFSSRASPSDEILNGLADMVVRLGGRTQENQDRWRFCCILLPKDPLLPLQKRSLVVQAQSKRAPHDVGKTIVSPSESVIALSLRAFQSGHIIYRPEVSTEDTTIALRKAEGPIRSAIAVPVGGENGMTVAVFYVVSDEIDAFSENDQQVLRMIGKMVEELLRTYHAQQQVTAGLRKLIEKPDVVDMLFEDFFSENEFTRDVELLLTGIQMQMQQRREGAREDIISLTDLNIHQEIEQKLDNVVSFIAVDIDNESSFATKFGDQLVKNLSRAVGQQLLRQLSVFFTKFVAYRLYHIYADRFYLLLPGVALEQAREAAERLRKDLRGPYLVSTSLEQPILPGNLLELDITVRLGVTSYLYTKLEELLLRPQYPNVTDVRALMARYLDEALNKGKSKGGNVIVAWNPDPQVWGLELWSSEGSDK